MITDARAAIKRIDKEIDANRKLPATPDRHLRECELFRQRGEAQLVRDLAEAELLRKAASTSRVKLKVCSKCGR